ncbi:hypothetical protein OYC64_017059 [Pagothenia borchgrevinki]|uniref:Coiled-coil domain-containing protein R3HCC1L n=1 Tax=Pagothenia borchgrevinki TaxID=8213 RepID=A0ABD2HM03_PAGBO
MELEQAKEDSTAAQPTPAPPAPSKKTGQAQNVPKQRLPGAKDKAQPQGEVKPRPRPRYTDKARKNAKNKKDKAGADKGAAAGGEGEAQNGDPEVKAEEDTEVNGQLDPTNVEAELTSRLEAAAIEEEEEEEEEGEEESWDTLFNDEGDCLDQHLSEELAVKQGRKKKSVQEARFDYYNMDKDAEDDIDLTDDELANIVEIYEFPAEFRTEDLLKLFQDYSQRGFDIQWIDESSALGLFSSPIAAREALRTKHPLMKLRPLSKCSPATKAKARSCSDYLLPAKERPQTSAALARRMVIGALGVKSNLTEEKREAEKKKLQEAKEQKRMAAKQKEDAWEGK